MTVTTCPYCQMPQTIKQLARFVLPERATYLDRHAELMQCDSCQQVFVSVYEEAVVESVNQWNVYHYYLPTALQRDVLIGATLCRAPEQRDCRCQLHTLITEIDFSTLQQLHP